MSKKIKVDGRLIDRALSQAIAKKGFSAVSNKQGVFVRKNTLIIQHGNYHYEYPKFLVSDLYHLPFKNDKFDHINCCGSVLGVVRDIDSALLEMSRLLKVEGTLFIQVDSRWSLDTLWMMLDYFLLHKLGFYTSRNDVNKIIFSSILKDIIVDYPYGEYEGFQDKNYKIKLKLFSPFALQKTFVYII